jgi:hypothetical protein
MRCAIIFKHGREILMSRSQIHALDKIVYKNHCRLKREFKIMEIKRTIYSKLQKIIDNIVDTYFNIIDSFIMKIKA